MNENNAYMAKCIQEAMQLPPLDPLRIYWYHVDLVLTQLGGMYDGYQHARHGACITALDEYTLSGVHAATDARAGQGNLTENMLLYINLGGDMGDIMNALGTPNARPARNAHCSGLLKLLENNKDIYIAQVCLEGAASITHSAGQTTWTAINGMLRAYKLYDFPFTLDGTSSQQVPAVRSSFSSYPGSIFSGDDFYVLSSGMVVQETTIGAACMNTS